METNPGTWLGIDRTFTQGEVDGNCQGSPLARRSGPGACTESGI